MTIKTKFSDLRRRFANRKGSNSTQGSSFSTGFRNPPPHSPILSPMSERSYGASDMTVDVFQFTPGTIHNVAPVFSDGGGEFSGGGASESFVSDSGSYDSGGGGSTD